MISKSMLGKLKEFGLNSYEAKTWAALLLKGTATAGSLSEIAGVPRSRCYDVLESLEKRGFIIAKLGRPIKYIAVSPEEAVERLKDQLRKNTEEQIDLINEMKKAPLMDELNKLHTSGMENVKPEELTGVLRHEKNIYNHLSSMIRTSSAEVLISSDAQSLNEKSYFIKDALKAHKNTPKIRILTDAPLSSEAMKLLKPLAEIKTTDAVSKFCITDKAAAMFLTEGVDAMNESAIWINSTHLVKGLHDLFEAKWMSS